MRRAKQADKTCRGFGKAFEVLPVTGQVVAHHDNRVKPTQVQRLAQLVNRCAQNGAILTFPQASNISRPVIKNRDTPAESPAKPHQWLGILSGSKNKNLVRSRQAKPDLATFRPGRKTRIDNARFVNLRQPAPQWLIACCRKHGLDQDAHCTFATYAQPEHVVVAAQVIIYPFRISRSDSPC